MNVAHVFALTSLMACLPHTSFAIPVYSKLDSPLSSAQSTRRELQKDIQQVVEVPWVRLILADGKSGWIREKELWNVLSVSELVKIKGASAIFSSPNRASVKLTYVTDGLWKIINVRDEWLQVEKNQSKQLAWIEQKNVLPYERTWDHFIIVRATDLKLSASTTAKRVCALEPWTKVKFLAFAQRFAKVYACGGIGFIALDDVLTKAHFANRIFTPLGWEDIKRVNGSEVITKQNRPVSFAEISAFYFDEKIRFSKNRTMAVSDLPNKTSLLHTYQLPAKSALTTSEKWQERWGLSKLDSMGQFWWNMSLPAKEKEKTFSTKELLSGRIYDIATHPKNPNQRWLSSRGIYQTADGIRWQKHEFFDDVDYPLYISRVGRIYIGPFVSQDGGKSFKPFVRWDRLIRSLDLGNHVQLSQLRIGSIKALDAIGNSLKFVVYMGEQPLTVRTDDLGQTWKKID